MLRCKDYFHVRNRGALSAKGSADIISASATETRFLACPSLKTSQILSFNVTDPILSKVVSFKPNWESLHLPQKTGGLSSPGPGPPGAARDFFSSLPGDPEASDANEVQANPLGKR